MKQTTLCYLERDNQYLMLHRIKKEQDASHGKWIGVGGKCEGDESPDECLLREVKEESGLMLTDFALRGVITFSDNDWYEYMFLFSADDFEGEITECDEGELVWVEKEKVLSVLPIWEGDKIFLGLMAEGEPFFSLKLRYENRVLKKALLDCEEIDPDEYIRRSFV